MSLPPYLLRQQQHKIGKAGRKSETRLAKALGGRARPASGAMQGAKGDIAFTEFLMEAKSTTSASLGLKHEWLVKIAKEALAVGKRPVLAVSFVLPDGNAIKDGDWCCVPRYVFEEWLA